MAERVVQIRLTADGTGFVGEVRLAEQETDKWAETMAKLSGQVKIAITMLTGYAAVVGYGVKQVVEQQDAVGKLSQVYGIQIEQLSAYSHMAKLANISNEELALGLRSLIKNMDEAAAHRGDGGRIFQALGLSADGKGLDQVLGEVADKFASFKDGPEKAALALQLFGRSGERLIPMLNQGSAGIAAVKAEAERLGITFGGDASRQASEFVDNITRMNATFTASKMAIANDVIPALNSMIEKFLEAKQEGSGFFGALLAGLRSGGGDVQMAERELAESVDRRLQLQNDLLRLSRQSGSTAEGERAGIERQIARLDERIAQAQALLRVMDPNFMKGPGAGAAGEKGAAPRVLDLTQEKQLLNQLQDQYAQLTGHVNIYDSVQRKMTETEKQFDPVMRKQIETWALKIDAMRRAAIQSAGYIQVMQDQEAIDAAESARQDAAIQQRIELINQRRSAEIAAIQDPVVRARAAFDEESRLRYDQVIRNKENLDDFYKWRVAREAQLNEQLKPEYQKNLDAWSDSNRLMRDSWNSTMLAVQKTGEDMFIQFVTTGKMQIGDLARVTEAELARAFYRQTVGSAAGSGGGGILGWLASLGGGGSSGGGSSGGGGYVPDYHSGGVVGGRAMPMHRVPVGTFIGAPRLHAGLASDEFPAILQRGETVLPRGTSSSIVHAPLNLTIHAPGADAGTEARMRSVLRDELPQALYTHRRALMGLVNDQRREGGRGAL